MGLRIRGVRCSRNLVYHHLPHCRLLLLLLSYLLPELRWQNGAEAITEHRRQEMLLYNHYAPHMHLSGVSTQHIKYGCECPVELLYCYWLIPWNCSTAIGSFVESLHCYWFICRSGMICVYVTNERMTDMFTDIGETLSTNAADIQKYASNTLDVS